MKRIKIISNGIANEVSLMLLDEVGYTRREIGVGTLFEKLFRADEVVTGEYVIRIVAQTYEQSTRKLSIVDINEKDGSFTTEDGVTYSVQDFSDEKEYYLFKRHSSDMLKKYFSYLKNRKRIGNSYGKLILRSIYD